MPSLISSASMLFTLQWWIKRYDHVVTSDWWHFFTSEPVFASGSVTWLPSGETSFSSAVEIELVPSGFINSALLYVISYNHAWRLMKPSWFVFIVHNQNRIYEYQTLMPLHMYLYFSSLRFLLIRVQIRHKNTKNSWITYQILSFSVFLNKKSANV